MSTPVTPPENTAPAVGIPPAVLSPGKAAIPTAQLIATMLNFAKGVSDLILSSGRPPQVELTGKLTAVPVPGLERLSGEDTARIAGDLMSQNKQALHALKENGAADLSLPAASVAVPGQRVPATRHLRGGHAGDSDPHSDI